MFTKEGRTSGREIHVMAIEDHCKILCLIFHPRFVGDMLVWFDPRCYLSMARRALCFGCDGSMIEACVAVCRGCPWGNEYTPKRRRSA